MSPAPDRVDVLSLASRGTVIHGRYTLADLPRLKEAGALDGTYSEASFRFLERDGWPTVVGQVSGTLVLFCQRCVEPAEFAVDESFEVACVASATALDEASATCEAVLADPVRLDLRWLMEEQLLLALPLVPRHAAQDCGAKLSSQARQRTEKQPLAEELSAEEAAATKQQPFSNLRDLLRNS